MVKYDNKLSEKLTKPQNKNSVIPRCENQNAQENVDTYETCDPVMKSTI